MNDRQWQPIVAFGLTLSGWLAAPLIAALFIGRYLDNHWSIEPWGTLAAVGIAFIISNVGMVIEAKHLFKQINQTSQKLSKPENHDNRNE
ncbi:MAG: AtpZ/AtpI family protein [Patescibacteria group bacterium]|nr:AtpZ/AtpI family protein [Patescibacteria group bacterium]